MRKQQSHKFWESKLRQKDIQIRELQSSIEELKSYVKLINKQLENNEAKLTICKDIKTDQHINNNSNPEMTDYNYKYNYNSCKSLVSEKNKNLLYKTQDKQDYLLTERSHSLNSDNHKELTIVNQPTKVYNKNKEPEKTNLLKPTENSELRGKPNCHKLNHSTPQQPIKKKNNNNPEKLSDTTVPLRQTYNKPKVNKQTNSQPKNKPQNNTPSTNTSMDPSINGDITAQSNNNNKRKLDNQEDRDQKKVTDYSLGISVYTIEPIENSDIAKYIAVLLMGCKYTKTYNPLKKKHVLQIFAKNEIELVNIKKKLNHKNNIQNAPCLYIAASMNYKSALADVIFTGKTENELIEPLKRIIKAHLNQKSIEGVNISYNNEKKTYSIKSTTNDLGLHQELINSGFENFKTLTQLATEGVNKIRLQLPKSFNEEDCINAVKEIFNVTKTNFNLRQLEINQTKSWFDENDYYYNLEYTCNDINEVNQVVSLQGYPLKGSQLGARTVFKGFSSVGEYYKNKQEKLLMPRIMPQLTNTNLTANQNNFETRLNNQERKIDSMQKDMEEIKEQLKIILLKLDNNSRR